jgi:hypothetical protein
MVTAQKRIQFVHVINLSSLLSIRTVRSLSPKVSGSFARPDICFEIRQSLQGQEKSV